MLVKCNQIDYLQISLDYILLCELSSFKVCSKNYFINYEENLSCFKKCFTEDLDHLKLSDLDSKKLIENIDSLNELRMIANDYEFLAVDDLNLFPLFEDFSYIYYENFKDSIEGLRWKNILQIRNSKIVDVNLLKALEIESDIKQWNDFIFPYIDYDSLGWGLKSLEEIYYSFFKRIPSFIPKSIYEMDDYICVYKNSVGKKKIVSKYLAHYIDKPLLYIGTEPTNGVNRAVSYDVRHERGKSFNHFIAKDDFNEYIRDLHLFSNDKNFYYEIHKLVKKDVFSYLNGGSYGKWYHFLEVNAELMKLLGNVSEIFNICVNFIKENKLKVSDNRLFDFFDYEKKHGIDFVLYSNLKLSYKNLEEIKKSGIKKYTIISKDGVNDIDLKSFIDEKKDVNYQTKLEEFFNWVIIDY